MICLGRPVYTVCFFEADFTMWSILSFYFFKSVSSKVASYPGSSDGNSLSCSRLKEEKLDCAACVSDPPPIDGFNCNGLTPEDDLEAEVSALFGGRAHATKLYNQTEFLFIEDGQIPQFEVTIDNDIWLSAHQEANLWKEEYMPATVKYGDKEWKNVGIRLKGSVGSLRICAWYATCKRFSYKLKFNHIDKTQTFFGLKKLQFHASLLDGTFMRERLAYSIYRSVGVKAVRQKYSQLVVNGNNIGVRLLTEVVDGRFTDTFWEHGDGNLYKQVWPGNLFDSTVLACKHDDCFDELVPRPKSDWITYGLRTNEEVANVTRMREFDHRLNSIVDDYQLSQVIKEFTPAEHNAFFFALNIAMDDWDGSMLFRWEEDQGMSRDAYWNHNFYLYRDDHDNYTQQKFHPIPWDMDEVWQRDFFDIKICVLIFLILYF